MLRMLFLLSALFGAAAPPLHAQDTGGTTVESPCDGVGATVHHPAVASTSGLQACEWGMIEFHFGGVKLSWEDPVCPLFILIEPFWTESGQKHGMRIVQVTLSRAMKFNYQCDEETENCSQISIDEIGNYPLHVDTGCGTPPDIQPPSKP